MSSIPSGSVVEVDVGTVVELARVVVGAALVTVGAGSDEGGPVAVDPPEQAATNTSNATGPHLTTSPFSRAAGDPILALYRLPPASPAWSDDGLTQSDICKLFKPMKLLRVAALAVGLSLLAHPAGAAESIDELKKKRAAIDDQQAVLASQVDALEADAAEIEASLQVLEADVAAHQELLNDVQRSLGVALAEVEVAERVKQQAEANVSDLNAQIQVLAVQAYVQPETSNVFAVWSSDDPLAGSTRKVLIEEVTGRDRDVIDQYHELRLDLEMRVADSQEAIAAAEARKGQLDIQLGLVQESVDRQNAFLDEVEARMDHALSESAALEAVDAQLAERIRTEEARIAAELARRRREAQERQRNSGPIPDFPGPGELRRVGGITVHESIADNLQGLLSAASSDGIVLGGGGYRDNSRQIALRRSHCGSTEYAIWQMPSYRCRPPTARPGRSMHERGLAVDFTYNGRAITSRSSPAFIWLADNAGRFGFRNLPSEPWHWSTTGS